MTDCIFCRIIAGEIPTDMVDSTADFVAFRDLRPLAPVHILVVPRQHVTSLEALDELPEDVAAAMMPFAAEVARLAGVADSGYRVVANCGPDAGQEVMHLHWHVIGGALLGGMA